MIIFLLIVSGLSVDLFLKPNSFICTGIMSSFDPINVDIKFPQDPNKTEGQHFKVAVASMANSQAIFQLQITPGTHFRKSLQIEKNIIYELCITFVSDRQFPEDYIIYIPFTQTEDFSRLISHIQIPEELANEKNLKQMYITAKKIINMNEIIASHQGKERVLEDQISIKTLHRTQRTLSIGLVECLVILLSGFYQIFALRRFLIEKNVY